MRAKKITTVDQSLEFLSYRRKTTLAISNSHGLLTQLSLSRKNLETMKAWVDERLKELSKPDPNCPNCQDSGK
jgi:hypothetical protein